MKNYILKSLAILLWQVISFTSIVANDGTNSVTFNIDHTDRVKVTLLGTNEVVDLSNPVFQWASGTTFMMEASSDLFKISSVKINGSIKNPSGDGKYRWGVNGDLTVEISTSENTSELTFEATDPSHILVSDNNFNVLNIENPVKVQTGSLITIEPFSSDFIIESLNAGGRDLYPSGDGKFRFVASNNMVVTVKSKSIHPIVTFEIDYPIRVNIINALTDQIIDISKIKVPIPVNTPLTIETSDPKHTILSVEMNGRLLNLSGDGKFHTGITADSRIVIKTKSSKPMVKFDVDATERVNIWYEDLKIDPSFTHEVEKGSQFIIESANSEFRIASVLVNNTPIKGASNGKYYTTAMSDILVTVRTKGILPVLSLNADYPERILITNLSTQEIIPYAELIELPKGTEVSISPLKANFSITSIKNNGIVINPDENGAYKFLISDDFVLNITTSAILKFTIEGSIGGQLCITKEGVELKTGDKVNPGDILDINYTLTDGFALDFITINTERVTNKYVVKGSEDIIAKATFRTLAENKAIVLIKVNNPSLVYLWYNGTFANHDTPVEVTKGDRVRVTPFGSAEVLSVKANDESVLPNNDNAYVITVEKNTVIDIQALKRIYVTGGRTYDDNGQIGQVFIKYNGIISESANVRAGETVELIKEYNSNTHQFIHYIIGYNENQKHYEDTYTVTQNDIDTDRSLSFTGVFDLATSSDKNVIQKSRYNESRREIITNGGTTKVFSISGECVISSQETIIGINTLKNGIYIVRTSDSTFKIVKK